MARRRAHGRGRSVPGPALALPAHRRPAGAPGARRRRQRAPLPHARARARALCATRARQQAIDWIKAFTSTNSQRSLQAKGNIPNATNLLGNSVNERAAQRSWFIPTAKHWVDVENGNVLRTMLSRILSGRATVQQAAS